MAKHDTNESPVVAENGTNTNEPPDSVSTVTNSSKEVHIPDQEEYLGTEVLDPIPVGDHRVIIDSFEKIDHEEGYSYLHFELVGLDGQVSDSQITHRVPYTENRPHTSRSKLGKLIKAAIPNANGKVNFKNDLLQKQVMIRVVENDPYLNVDAVWAVGQDPPISQKVDNGEPDNVLTDETKADEDHNPPKKSSVPTV